MSSPDALELSPELAGRLGELADLGSVGQVLAWDQQVMMPRNGGPARGEVLATIERLSHARLVDPELGTLLDAVPPQAEKVARAVRRDHERARRVPAELAAEMAKAGPEGYASWLQAREANDFAVFAPALKRNVELARKLADCFADEVAHPYDALVDQYEPGATAAELTALFDQLQAGLVPLISAIARKPEPSPLPGELAISAQREIGLEMIKAMGFDESSWRLDDAVHPFAVSPAATDIRVTARFEDRSPTGLFALLHEVGHGLYEHGVDPRLARTTTDQGASLGVHESQSRLWENMVGRSEPFWRYWLPLLRERCPLTLRDVSLEQFLRAINVVKPTLIRVEADEVTYSLHVILRFELELALLEGTLEVDDLPDAWAAKTKQLLGLDVPDDNHGVLQDIHWSEGIIGYFPTYAVGNVLAAQLWDAVNLAIGDLEDQIARAEYGGLREWLREHVHQYGRTLLPPEIVQQAVGGPLDVAPLLRHLGTKYGALYEL